MGLLGFGGAAAEAAQVATHHTTVLLDHHAGACEAVARAAEKAAEEVAAIKMRLQVIRDAAREHHLTIAYATGTALPPPDLSSYSRPISRPSSTPQSGGHQTSAGRRRDRR